MTTEQLTISGLAIDVVRKNIKNLHLAVCPPHGQVRIAVPLHIDNEAVRLAIISRLGWIKRQQVKFAKQPRLSAREYITGESHYFQGQRYLLNVIYHAAPPKVILRHSNIDLYVREGSNISKRQQVLNAWYRQQLKTLIPALIDKWQPSMGVKVQEWGVKQMKTRWGTCNIRDGRIWLALGLAEKPLSCLEYVVVHEMTHLLERHHNDRFKAYMTQFLPNWQSLKHELNQMPLVSVD